jgi:hypothetical protein
VPECNRVTPHGDIIATSLRGSWLGNRGSIHRGHDIVRGWASKLWITCALEYKGWVAPKWVPKRWTALFFYDEALAFAAGHRPCALCRRVDYNRYRTAVGIDRAVDIDKQLHAERVENRRKRTHRMVWRSLPRGAFVDISGVAHVVLDDTIRPWTAERGYGEPVARPVHGEAVVLTPPLSLAAIANGYAPQIALPA